LFFATSPLKLTVLAREFVVAQQADFLSKEFANAKKFAASSGWHGILFDACERHSCGPAACDNAIGRRKARRRDHRETERPRAREVRWRKVRTQVAGGGRADGNRRRRPVSGSILQDAAQAGGGRRLRGKDRRLHPGR